MNCAFRQAGKPVWHLAQSVTCNAEIVINGDNDTLLSTQDSVDLATEAPLGELKLYPNDDHCAMGHYHEWLALSQTWMLGHLLPAASPP